MLATKLSVAVLKLLAKYLMGSPALAATVVSVGDGDIVRVTVTLSPKTVDRYGRRHGGRPGGTPSAVQAPPGCRRYTCREIGSYSGARICAGKSPPTWIGTMMG
jgi:hypothetical protein